MDSSWQCNVAGSQSASIMTITVERTRVTGWNLNADQMTSQLPTSRFLLNGRISSINILATAQHNSYCQHD